MKESSRLEPHDLLVGLFVGGASRRMGQPKGLLSAPDRSGRTLVERLQGEIAQALPGSPLVLVGERAEYMGLSLPVLEDESPGCGPLGGLVALLARGQELGAVAALSVACDLPYLEAPLLRRIATEEPGGEVVCPHLDGRYQPLVARYSVSLLPRFRKALRDRRLSLQPLVAGARVVTLELSASEKQSLSDWDTRKDAGLI